MLKFIINIILFLVFIPTFSQEAETEEVYKDRYGIRFGIDVMQPIYSLFDDKKNGLEIVGDYRITKKLFIAAELGYNDTATYEDFYNFRTNGSYIKFGVDANVYKNWIGMENLIYAGLRYGFSVFDQTLNEVQINADPFLPPQTLPESINYNSLNASWVSIVFGIKVEVLHNVFLGFSVSGNKLISSKEPENFKNLFIPGFNKVFVNSNGYGFNYTITYLIPFYKKDH